MRMTAVPQARVKFRGEFSIAWTSTRWWKPTLADETILFLLSVWVWVFFTMFRLNTHTLTHTTSCLPTDQDMEKSPPSREVINIRNLLYYPVWGTQFWNPSKPIPNSRAIYIYPRQCYEGDAGLKHPLTLWITHHSRNREKIAVSLSWPCS